jgi:hypothetical protein
MCVHTYCIHNLIEVEAKRGVRDGAAFATLDPRENAIRESHLCVCKCMHMYKLGRREEIDRACALVSSRGKMKMKGGNENR